MVWSLHSETIKGRGEVKHLVIHSYSALSAYRLPVAVNDTSVRRSLCPSSKEPSLRCLPRGAAKGCVGVETTVDLNLVGDLGSQQLTVITSFLTRVTTEGSDRNYLPASTRVLHGKNYSLILSEVQSSVGDPPLN